MNTFKTEKETVDGIDTDFERSWLEFVKLYELEKLHSNKKPNSDVLAFYKQTFRYGYMSGVKFVGETIIEKMISNPPKEPPK